MWAGGHRASSEVYLLVYLLKNPSIMLLGVFLVVVFFCVCFFFLFVFCFFCFLVFFLFSGTKYEKNMMCFIGEKYLLWGSSLHRPISETLL